jgi:NADPH-dependent 2,4-dienoyl-CoA reductase/sulfur reductase-like enzyme/peroxiredoxin family protein/rhodanese-related sulfurtransferase/TusA-related sulfurtransferase
MKYLIIGGVAGGATVAARLRRLDEQAEIILFERGEYVSYANCGLPYYIGGEINERKKLFVQTVQGFIDRFRVDIRTEQEVIAIHTEQKTVEIHHLKTGETYSESYDKLALSPGAEPLRPRIPGIDNNKIFTLRNVPDTDAIKNYIIDNKPKSAIVVGGGFIGLEMAENLHRQGIQVSIVEMADQVMAPLDFSMAQMVHEELVGKGVKLILGDGVESFSEKNGQVTVNLKSGSSQSVDMVLLSIGIRPETKLAAEAGLKIGTTRGIAVNEYMQTSDESVYALGDACEIVHGVTGKPAMIPLAGPANKQGRIVADNMVFGNRSKYNGTIGTSIAKVFDLTVAAAGANAKLLKREGIEYLSSFTHSSSHAGYYPKALSMTIKILFSPSDGRLLGTQIVGYDGVDKRIEMAAQVIQHHGSVYDLAELEQAYAPPYSAAKDPINMAGFVAENILDGKVKIAQWRDIKNEDNDTLILDVRTADEFSLGAIPGSINIPLDSLRSRLAELPSDKPIVTTCAVGLRGYTAYRILVQNNFTNVCNLSGGFKTWHVATTDWKNQMPSVGNSINISTEVPSSDAESKAAAIEIDACGLMCPGPVMKLKQSYGNLTPGSRLTIKATDPAFAKDVSAWCNITGAKLIHVDNSRGMVQATIEKSENQPSACVMNATGMNSHNGKTLIVFSDDLDRALASFVLANGAASTGKHVTMFFTFWGLNVIKKRQKPSVEKDIFGKMFGMMLPSNSKSLSLSKMNMCGIGSRMMRHIMKTKRIDSLESMIQQAIDNGVEMIACTMSMDVMGVKKEELLDNVQLGGVASYLEKAEGANMNLFI